MTEIPGAPFAAARLIAHMAHDKKAEAGRLTFILLDAIGHALIERRVPVAAVEAVLKAGEARCSTEPGQSGCPRPSPGRRVRSRHIICCR